MAETPDAMAKRERVVVQDSFIFSTQCLKEIICALAGTEPVQTLQGSFYTTNERIHLYFDLFTTRSSPSDIPSLEPREKTPDRIYLTRGQSGEVLRSTGGHRGHKH